MDTELVITDKHICENAYKGRSDIVHLILRDVWSVGPGAFSACPNLTSVVCTNGPAVICEDAFSGCSALNTFVFPDALHTISERAFSSCGLIAAVFPPSLSLLGNSCFEDCLSLEKVLFPSHLNEIGASAFSGCSSLCDLQLPETEVYHDGCFAQTSAVLLDIPSCVRYIGRDAFSGCQELRIVQFENPRVRLRATSFQYCDQLKHAVFPHVHEEEHRVLSSPLTQNVISCSLDRFDREIRDPVTAFFRLAFPYALTGPVQDHCIGLVRQDPTRCTEYIRTVFPYLSEYQSSKVVSCAAEFDIGGIFQN